MLADIPDRSYSEFSRKKKKMPGVTLVGYQCFSVKIACLLVMGKPFQTRDDLT